MKTVYRCADIGGKSHMGGIEALIAFQSAKGLDAGEESQMNAGC